MRKIPSKIANFVKGSHSYCFQLGKRNIKKNPPTIESVPKIFVIIQLNKNLNPKYIIGKLKIILN